MFNHSAKQIQSYRPPDAEIKKSHLISWVKGSTAALCTAVKIILNPSYAEFDRDTQTALCLHAPSKGSKSKTRNTNKPWEAFQHKFCPQYQWWFMCNYLANPYTIGMKGPLLTFWGICSLKAMALQQFRGDEYISLIAVLVSVSKLTIRAKLHSFSQPLIVDVFTSWILKLTNLSSQLWKIIFSHYLHILHRLIVLKEKKTKLWNWM